MTSFLNSQKTIGVRLYIISFILLIAVFLIKIAISTPPDDKNSEIPISIRTIEYMEDRTQKLELADVQSKEYTQSFSQHTGSSLSIGQSRSTWWIRIMPGSITASVSQKYLAINNPTVEKAVLYIPSITQKGTAYKTLRSGWSFYGSTQEEGFIYPVFKLDDGMDISKPIYIQLRSPFTQNYNISILQGREFNKIKLKSILVVGIFFGLLLAMGINNFINYLSLRDGVHLYYVIYIFLMISYQGALLGIYRTFMGRLAEALIGNVITLGLCTVAAAVMFFRAFLSTPKYFPRQDNYSKVLLILCLAGIFLMISDLRYEASIFSTLLAAAVILLIVYTSAKAALKGIRQAKYFLAGWCAMLLSFVVFAARVWGLLPNNDLTLFIVIMSASVEAILLSAALANRVKVLREEKENALLLFKNAEETSISNESAFLQAQIKPHFIYNALNVIATLCRIDAEKARQLILDLSSYLHHSFDFSNRTKYITFDEELEFIQAYIRIEQARFKDKLKVEYEVEDTEELRVPPLILQPLVENAIRHGIRESDEGGTVVLRVKNHEDHFLIEIDDDGAGMTEEQLGKITSESSAEHNGVGLANIQRRLRMLYGTQLIIQSQVGKGTKISLALPKRKDND